MQEKETAEIQRQKAEIDKERTIIDASVNAERTIIEAESQAKSNQLLNQSITQTLVNYEWVNKWNGEMPKYSGGGTPLITIPNN